MEDARLVQSYSAGDCVAAEALRRPAPQGTRLVAGAEGCRIVRVTRGHLDGFGQDAVMAVLDALEVRPPHTVGRNVGRVHVFVSSNC